MRVHQSSGLIEPRRRVLIAQAKVDCQVRTNLPSVVNVVILAERAELNRSQRDGGFAPFAVSQKKICKGVPTAASWTSASGWLKPERAPGELIAHLVILVLAQLTTKPERVFSFGPGKVIGQLVGVILINVRSFGIIAKAVVARDTDAGNSPCNGWTRSDTRDA